MKINESEKVDVNGHTVVITRTTKYVYLATDTEGKKITTGKSKPKLLEKLEKLLPKEEKPKAKTKTKPETKTGTKPKKKKTKFIKAIVLDSIIASLTDKEIVEKINSEFPDSKFDQKHMAWYRSTLARDGVISHEFAPKFGKLHKAWKEKQPKEKVNEEH